MKNQHPKSDRLLGVGTGLGLSTAYGIVKQNNGFINVYSELGIGTTFKIYLRRHEGEDETAHTSNAAQELQGSGETILLVEDEPMILNFGKIMLETLGYSVLTAIGPKEAIVLAQEYPEPINLLITDVVMPGMNGRDLAVQLQKVCPGLKTLFMSGYTADVIASHGVLEKGLQFLQKPFLKNELATKVHETITGK
jgi:two-component system, cell cycle sensor histidine kinase and response regulator CckA